MNRGCGSLMRNRGLVCGAARMLADMTRTPALRGAQALSIRTDSLASIQ
jgi:hypothetical protein